MHTNMPSVSNGRCRMSGEQSTSNNVNANHQDEGLVVIDAVHARFRKAYVRCDDCNRDIAWDDAAIRNHFVNSHPSNKYCRYCGGKVFMYRKKTEDVNDRSQEFVYHKCEHNEQTTRIREESA